MPLLLAVSFGGAEEILARARQDTFVAKVPFLPFAFRIGTFDRPQWHVPKRRYALGVDVVVLSLVAAEPWLRVDHSTMWLLLWN